MAVLFHDYPWHAAVCGDLDLTGYRKPQSYYRDILWNGGDRVYATVRLPEPPGKKIIAIDVGHLSDAADLDWPGQEGKEHAGGSLLRRGKGPAVSQRQADRRESPPAASRSSRPHSPSRTRRAH